MYQLRRSTVTADHGLPFGVSIWRAFNSRAAARADRPESSPVPAATPRGAPEPRHGCGGYRHTEPDALRLLGGERVPGALGDHRALFLGKRREQEQHEGVSISSQLCHDERRSVRHRSADEVNIEIRAMRAGTTAPAERERLTVFRIKI